MTTETAIQILQAHNNWRKGLTDDFVDPIEYSQAIDHAISELKAASDNKRIRETVIEMYEQEKRLRDKYEDKQNGYRFAHRAMALRDLIKKIGGKI